MRSGFSIIVVFVALAICGCVLLPLLPVKLFPSRELPSLTVSFEMPYNSARVIEQEVTSRLEGALARVEGVRGIKSRSGNGRGTVNLSLDRHADIDMTRLEVSTIIRQLWGSMPEGVKYPEVSARQAKDEAKAPFMTYTVTSPMTSMEINSYIEDKVSPRLSDIPGVASVQLHGAVPNEWRLEYDADKIAAMGITPQDISRAISRHYATEFLGMPVSGDEFVRLVKRSEGGPGRFDPSEITVTASDGTFVTLDKIVKTSYTDGTPTSYFRINGLNSIYLNITAEEDANQLEVGETVARVIADAKAQAPAGMDFILSNDATDTIREELDKIYFRTGLTVLILLLFIIIVTRNFRYTALIVVSLAINLAIAVIFYYMTGIEIQLYSLAGITISLNLVIDNTIVMCDHYMRCRDRRAFPAILAATLTTAGALVVVFFLDEDVRLNLEDFVIVVIVNLLVSLLVALFLVPALADRFAVSVRKRRRGGRWSRKVALLSNRIYRGYIRFSLRWKWGLVVVMCALIGLSGWQFFSKVREGGYFNRDQRERMLYINASLPNGATLSQMDALMRRMESYLAGFQDIRQFQTNIYNGRQGSITVRFTKEGAKNGFPYRLKSDVVSKALTLGGGSWSVYGLEDHGFNNDVRESAGSFKAKISGFNYDELMSYAVELRDSLLSHRRIKEVEIKSDYSYWKTDYTEYSLAVDRRALASAGLTVQDFYTALSQVFGRDMKCGSIQSGGVPEPIKLSSLQSGMYDVWSLLNVPLSVKGKDYRVSDFAEFERGSAPQDIVKENQSYRVCLQYDYIGSNEQGKKLLDRRLDEFNAKLPAGYYAESDEWHWRWKDKDYSRYMLLGVVALIIFFLSSVLFNSLLRPLAIIAVIPMSYVGIFLTFWFFDLKFDQGGFASFILLSGITVNAAIYLINEYDTLRVRSGRKGVRFYMQAFRVKIMPVILTVISTVLGFIPFIVGSDRESFWFPLAAGTIGGLLFSLIAIVGFLPMMLLPHLPRRARKSSRRESETGM